MKPVENNVIEQESIQERNLEILLKNFPGVVSTGEDGELVINAEKLKLALDPKARIEENGYELNWVGKKEAYHQAYAKQAKILQPLTDDSNDFLADTTENILIKGDNLEALKLLKASYFEKIKMIYIDPPYNTKSENFIYRDNFTDSEEAILDELGYSTEYKDYIENIQGARTHSGWLSFMFPRLLLARDLLKEDGVIFISIGEEEVNNLRILGDEIFGEHNFITLISRVMKTGGAKGKFFTPNIDYILIYAKDLVKAKPFRTKITKEQLKSYYNKVETTGNKAGEIYGEERLFKASLDARPNQRYWIKCPDGSFVIPPGKTFPEHLEHGEQVTPNSDDGVWKWVYSTYQREYDLANIIFKETSSSALIDQNGNKSKYNLYNKVWLRDQQEKGKVPANFMVDLLSDYENRQSSAELFEMGIPFDYAKPVDLISYLAVMAKVDKDDIVLDFFAGSGTTGQAVMDLNAEDGGNRQFILVQLPEEIDAKKQKDAYEFVTETLGKKEATIFEITAERLRRAGEKAKKNHADKAGIENLDIGFKAFEIKDDPLQQFYKPLHEVTANDLEQLEMILSHDSVEASFNTILVNLLLAEKLPLSTPIITLDEGALYQADNVLLVINAVDLSEIKLHLQLSPGLPKIEYISVYSPNITNETRDQFNQELIPAIQQMGLDIARLRFRG